MKLHEPPHQRNADGIRSAKRRIALAAALLLTGICWKTPGSAIATGLQAQCGHVGTLVGFTVIDRATIVGSTDQGNMARSIDGGHCWFAAALDKPLTHRMGDFVRDPLHPHVLVAGSGSIGRIGIGSTFGLLRSGNDGRTWRQLGNGNGLPGTSFDVTALVGTTSGLYVAVACIDELSVINSKHLAPFVCGVPIYRSTNGGMTWAPVGPGAHLAPADASTPPFEGSVQALAALPNGSVVAAVSPLRGKPGLYRSNSVGTSWSLIGPERRLNDASVLIVASKTGPTIVAGVGSISTTAQLLRSTDGGRTWRRVLAPAQMKDPIVIGCAHTVHALLCAGLQHLFRSTDNGTSWQEPASLGLTSSNITFITTSPDGSVYLSRVGGLFRTTDDGEHWQRL